MLCRLLTTAPLNPQRNYQCAWTCDSLGLEAEATLRRGLERFPDGTEFDVFLALTEYNRQAYPKAMERLLRLLLTTTADPHLKKLARALTFYADKLDQTW